MTPFPPDAQRVVLAAVVPCRYGYSGTNTDMGGNPIRCDRAPEDGRYRLTRCATCLGDGTRTVVTDTEVEPDDALSGDRVIRVWLEVES